MFLLWISTCGILPIYASCSYRSGCTRCTCCSLLHRTMSKVVWTVRTARSQNHYGDRSGYRKRRGPMSSRYSGHYIYRWSPGSIASLSRYISVKRSRLKAGSSHPASSDVYPILLTDPTFWLTYPGHNSSRNCYSYHNCTYRSHPSRCNNCCSSCYSSLNCSNGYWYRSVRRRMLTERMNSGVYLRTRDQRTKCYTVDSIVHWFVHWWSVSVRRLEAGYRDNFIPDATGSPKRSS